MSENVIVRSEYNPAIPEASTAGLSPVWTRAMDEAMGIELALELAELLAIGPERDLIIYAYRAAQNVQPALDILHSAGALIFSIDPARTEHIASTYAHLAWRVGATQIAEHRALMALTINPANVLARITLAAIRKPANAAIVREKLITGQDGNFLPLLVEASKARALGAQYTARS